NTARIANRDALDCVLGGWIRARTLKENLEFFEREEITAAPIYSAREIADDAHFQQREIFTTVEDEQLGAISMHNITPRLSRSPGNFRIPAPSIGQHNAELLEDIGFDKGEIDALTKRGVLWQASAARQT